MSPVPNGVDYLLVDRQVDVASETAVYRCTYRICSQEGLQNSSNLIVEFDPSYQKISYQFLRVWRDGVARDALAGAEIKLIQQEKDLALNMYNGRVSALIMIPDLRVGDVVDYAFTRTGGNPVFGGKYVDEITAAWSMPVRWEHVVITVPADRPLRHRDEGKVPLKFRMTRAGGFLRYEWQGKDLPPVVADPDTPAWYPTYGYIDVSEYADWAEVAAWAERLFRLPKPEAGVKDLAAKVCGEALKRKNAAMGDARLEFPQGGLNPAPAAGRPGARKSPDELKALALIDFVQREVRYLGIEMGPYSHQPNDPGVVLRQRYGDCKDKARLLCALLEASGIRAEPVLLNTWRGAHLRGSLPSPDAFNHAIVQVHLGDGVHFVDATQSYQKGDIGTRGLARDTCGLVVTDGTRGLSDLPADPARLPTMIVNESISVPAYAGSAHDQVFAVYSGAWGDAMRAYFTGTAPEAVKRNFLNLFKEEFPQLEPTSEFKWFDDPATGSVSAEIAFDIPDVWTKVAAGSENVRTEFWPVALRRFFQQPKSIERTAPLAVEFPCRIEEQRTFTMPDSWQLAPKRETVENGAFRFVHEIRSEGRTIVLSDRWTSLADSVPASGLGAYVAKLAAVRRAADEALTRNLDLTRRLAAGGVHWSALAFMVSGLCAGLLGALALVRRRSGAPPLLGASASPALSGWLILPTIGLVLGLFFRLAQVLRQMRVVLDERVWVRISVSHVPAYAHWGLFVTLETFGQAFLLAWTGAAFVALARRSRGAPKTMVGLLTAGVVYTAFEVAITSWNSANGLPGGVGRQMGSLITAVIGAAIWIPYFLVSKRVERTFVR